MRHGTAATCRAERQSLRPECFPDGGIAIYPCAVWPPPHAAPASVVTDGIRPRHKPARTARPTIWQSAPCAPGGKTAHITMRNLRFCKPERPVLAARTARLPTAGKQPWKPPRQRRAEDSAATWRNYSCLRRPTWHPQPRPAAKIALRPPAAHGLAGPQTELNRAWRPGRQAWPCAAGRTACASRGQDAYR